MKIGVLALQGAFAEHVSMLRWLGAKVCEIRQARDFTDDLDGLIIPGGESTVIAKLMAELRLLEPIKRAAERGLPLFGTCAGLILLAKEVVGPPAPGLCVMDTVAKRNAYGRQLGSFSAHAEFSGIGEIPMTFIRAPYIVSADDAVEVLARVEGKIVAARQKNILATAFHPELTQDTRVHTWFLRMVSQYRETAKSEKHPA